VRLALVNAGINYFNNGGDTLIALDNTATTLVEVDQAFIRPAEVPLLCADPRKAVQILGYDPSAQNFEALVAEMVQSAMNSHGVLQSA